MEEPPVTWGAEEGFRSRGHAGPPGRAGSTRGGCMLGVVENRARCRASRGWSEGYAAKRWWRPDITDEKQEPRAGGAAS